MRSTPRARICWSRLHFLWLMVASLSSCSSPPPPPRPATVPVSGKVFLNQKPLVRALVVFHPVQTPRDGPFRGYAQTGEDGSFRLSTFEINDGIPPGKYRVTIQLQDEDAGTIRLPARYGQPDSSGLTVEINSKPMNLNPFHLRTP